MRASINLKWQAKMIARLWLCGMISRTKAHQMYSNAKYRIGA